MTLHGQDAARRERIARSFAERAVELPGTREVRLTAVDGELAVTVLTEDRDMERDLLMHSLFVSATADLDDAATLRILVYRADRAAEAGSLLV